jgi:hypothetical protein
MFHTGYVTPISENRAILEVRVTVTKPVSVNRQTVIGEDARIEARNSCKRSSNIQFR